MLKTELILDQSKIDDHIRINYSFYLQKHIYDGTLTT